MDIEHNRIQNQRLNTMNSLHKTLTALLLCCSLGAFADESQYFHTSQFFPASVQSPTASELGKYGDISVSHYTGRANVAIPLFSITQNEPLNRGHSASLFMGWQEQQTFIAQALGPAPQRAGLKTKLYAFDHNYNYDRPIFSHVINSFIMCDKLFYHV